MTWEQAVREHEKRLVVGARVRVRISPECHSSNHLGKHRDQAERGDGITGTIGFVYPDMHDRHDYGVRWGSTPPDRVTGWFCAAELVPIEDDAP